jgi:hypothetical protein
MVLAEDTRHRNFVRKYLKRRRYDGEIRFENPPSGRGCGEQWVRENYARAVGAYRARSSKAKTALIVVIDADTNEVSRRVRQFKDALGNDPRKDDETIVHLIPKRNIETWILHLNGEQVDEETDHHNREVDGMILTAAAVFLEWTAQPPTDCLPSLSAAIQETQRLP